MSEYSSFMELLNCNEEFVFSYNGVKYEIINGDEYGNGSGITLYFLDNDDIHGIFIKSFKDIEDFLMNGEIEGHKICRIVDQIKNSMGLPFGNPNKK